MIGSDRMESSFSDQDLNRTDCPACKQASVRSALVIRRAGVPPAREGHNISYAHTVAALCASCGAGFFEIRKHDCLDFGEVFDQDEWLDFSPTSGAQLREFIRTCPDPMTENCVCPVHRQMRKLTISVKEFTIGPDVRSAHGSVSVRISNGTLLLSVAPVIPVERADQSPTAPQLVIPAPDPDGVPSLPSELSRWDRLKKWFSE